MVAEVGNGNRMVLDEPPGLGLSIFELGSALKAKLVQEVGFEGCVSTYDTFRWLLYGGF